MKIYLASQYRTKTQIKGYTRQLQDLGFTVTSTWVNEPHKPTLELPDLSPGDLRRLASRDLQEIRACDLLVLFTVSPLKATKRGGRHTEFGYALGLNKRMVICGPCENIFHYLPNVGRFDTFADFKQFWQSFENIGKR